MDIKNEPAFPQKDIMNSDIQYMGLTKQQYVTTQIVSALISAGYQKNFGHTEDVYKVVEYASKYAKSIIYWEQ